MARISNHCFWVQIRYQVDISTRSVCTMRREKRMHITVVDGPFSGAGAYVQDTLSPFILGTECQSSVGGTDV